MNNNHEQIAGHMSWPLEFCLTQLNSKEGAVEAAATASSTLKLV